MSRESKINGWGASVSCLLELSVLGDDVMRHLTMQPPWRVPRVSSFPFVGEGCDGGTG